MSSQYPSARDAAPNPDSVVSGSKYRFTLISDVVLRYEWADDGVFEDRPSTFVIRRNLPAPEFTVHDRHGKLEIVTGSFHLRYDKHRFGPDNLVVSFPGEEEGSWQGGEWRYGTAVQGNLGGTARTLDGANGRINVEPGVLSRAGFSSLDDSKSVLLSDDGFFAPRRKGDDRVDGYLFVYGTDYRRAIKAFYAISGQQPVLPRWAFGNWWSRYHSYTTDEYMTLVDRFKSSHMPLSVAVIDMGWHLDGWTGYTWNKRLFPDPKGFADELHRRNLKLTLNEHPHQGVHTWEEKYAEFSRHMGRDPHKMQPVPFDCADPQYMSGFFDILHRNLEKKGCDFWWLDWQQGTTSKMPGLDPLWALNHLQFKDTAKVTKDTEPLVLSRYGGPGSHRYPLGFSGDTISTWDSLKFQPEFTATASNIGYGWWSHDIGGHLAGSKDDEMTTRWVQLGVFSPIMRLHSTRSEWNSKEPWNYRPEFFNVMQKMLQLRHRLVPYLYTANIIVSETDIPLIVPLYWNYPTREEAYRYPSQYFFGPSLLVAPVVQPRDERTNFAKVELWVPPGRHVDLMTGFIYDGDRELAMYRSIERLPVLAPEGTIVPLDAKAVPANGCQNPDELEVLVVVGQDGSFTLLEDARDDDIQARTGGGRKTRAIDIKYHQKTGRLTTVSNGKRWAFRFISFRKTSSVRVFVDDVHKPDAAMVAVFSEGSLSLSDASFSTVVMVNGDLEPQSRIAIELGPDPQLERLDHNKTLYDMIFDYQINFGMKDRIWRIVNSSRSPPSKVSDLLGLGLDQEIVGPLIELIIADTREA